MLVLVHLVLIHSYSSRIRVGCDLDTKVEFGSYYVVKDLFVVFIIVWMMLVRALVFGYDLMDAENWIEADPLVTPTHIQPEWYFLFAYAVLRACPNKYGGIIGLLGRVLLLLAFRLKRRIGENGLFWVRLCIGYFVRFGVLTWLGMCPAEDPYIVYSKIWSMNYFFFLFWLLLL